VATFYRIFRPRAIRPIPRMNQQNLVIPGHGGFPMRLRLRKVYVRPALRG
jgi:hypothetical protein